MYQSELPRYLPTADELPCSDDTPVDNELQEIIPSLLKSILEILWKDRMDWFFGIDMAIYTDPDRFSEREATPTAIVPDGFLSLNVERVCRDRFNFGSRSMSISIFALPKQSKY